MPDMTTRTNGWMLLPAFAAQGLVNAGFEMGPINAILQLAPPGKVTEYAAIQTMKMGLSGVIIPLISVSLVRAGLGVSGVFALSLLLMALARWMFGRVQSLPVSQSSYVAHSQ